MAASLAEMGRSEEDARVQLLALPGGSDPGLLREAAGAGIAALPLPLDEDPEEEERRLAIRRMLGEEHPRTASDDLAATIEGRLWLERLAIAVERGEV